VIATHDHDRPVASAFGDFLGYQRRKLLIACAALGRGEGVRSSELSGFLMGFR